MKQMTYIDKKFFILISITIFAFGNASAAIMRDNDFYLYYGTGVTNLSMDYTGKAVSQGQPSGNLNTDPIEKDPEFDMYMLKGVFQAGRHKTVAIANAFINAADAKKDSKCYSILQTNMQKGGYVCPDALNFYIVTTLHINGSPVINPVFFAQGNNGRNNWWVGSIDAIKNQNTEFHNEYYYLEFKTESSGTYRISQFSGIPGKHYNNVNAFIIEKVKSSNVVPKLPLGTENQ